MAGKKTFSYLNYEGLYKGQAVQPYDFIFSEDIQTRSKDFNWEISKHFHSNLYQFFLAETGSVKLRLDDIEPKLQAPFCICIPPNYIHGFQFSEDIKGKILTFSEVYVKGLQGFEDLYNGILPGKVEWRSDLSLDGYQKLKAIVLNAHDEIFKDELHRFTAIQLALISLFVQLSRLAKDSLIHGSQTDRNLEYLRKFIQKIHEYRNPSVVISQYAEDLHLSESHLNRICRTVCGKSPLQLIQGIAINRAKAFLQHTPYDINEIAYQLGFDDPSYFSRLFKNQTGSTPTGFRKNLL